MLLQETCTAIQAYSVCSLLLALASYFLGNGCKIFVTAEYLGGFDQAKCSFNAWRMPSVT